MSNKKMPTSMYSPRPKTGKRAYDQSHWSLGWQKSPNSAKTQNSSFMKYHNQSSFILQDKNTPNYETRKDQMRKTKTETFNAKLPTYDPRNGNKSNIVFGDQKPDFSKKSSGITSPRVPPGGRSQIVFG